MMAHSKERHDSVQSTARRGGRRGRKQVEMYKEKERN